jgi:hypothetical protein
MPGIASRIGALALIPPVDAVRPRRCPSCLNIEGIGKQLLFYGHGLRCRWVAVPSPDPEQRLILAWQRRFLCTRCGTTVLVGPAGLLRRGTYTLFAILAAWFAALPAPLGDERTEVYAGHGVDRLAPDVHRRAPRWAALERWTRCAAQWWATRPVSSSGPWRDRVAALLSGFLAGDGGRDGAIARAVDAHAAAGAAM